MVQILPQVGPSSGTRLMNALAGVAQDVSEGFAAKRKTREANRPHAQTFLTSLLKQQGADAAYDPENLLKARKRADEYIDKGYNPTQAVFAAYEDLVSGFPEKGTKSKESQEPPQGTPNTKQGFGQKATEVLNQPATKYLGPIAKFLQSPLQMATQAPLDRLAEAAKNLPEKYLGEAREANANRPEDTALQKIVGATGLPWLQKLFQGLDPTGVLKRGEESLAEKGLSIFPHQNQLNQLSNQGAEATGEVLKDLLLYKGAGAAKTIPGKIGSAAGLFAGQKAVKTAVGEGRSPTVGELGTAAALGAGGEALGPAVKAATDFIKKIPKAYESVKAAVAGSKGAVTEEKIVEKAVQNLEARGVSVLKAAEGDSKALNEIQKETAKVADTYKQAEKYNAKEVEKIRSEKEVKLAQSPLEEYYAPKKVVEHRPETLAKEEERIKPLELKIKQNERSLRNLQYEILNSENYLKENAHKLNEAERTRIQALIDNNKLQHQKHLNEIRSAEFEMKYGKPPATTSEIKAQIEKSFEEIRAGIKDATADKVKKLEKALEQNKQVVETAERLVARGELPGPPVFDEFIKIEQEYVKAYGDLIDELSTFIKENKGEKALAGEVANAQKLKQLIQQTREQAKASIVNQTDKRKAMKTLSGASGALWKNLLKDVRKDVDSFQKDWASVRKTLSPQEIRTSEAAKKAISTEKPTPKPLEAGGEAKAAAAKKNADAELKDQISSFGQKFKSGKSTEKDVVKAEKATNRYLQRLSGLPGKLARGAIIGSLQSIFEEYTGIKIPVGILGAAVPGNIIGRGAGVLGAAYAHKLTNKLFDYIEEQKLRELRNTEDFHKHRMELEKRYSKARVNRIVKATQSK